MLIETLLLFPFALAYLLYLNSQGHLAFLHTSATTSWLLLASGFITTLPLIWFISASKKLRYSIIGMMQYIAPTLMGILGYYIYREGFPPGRLLTFLLVWSGLFLVILETLYLSRTKKY